MIVQLHVWMNQQGKVAQHTGEGVVAHLSLKFSNRGQGRQPLSTLLRVGKTVNNVVIYSVCNYVPLTHFC
jgi:hypothetical protein